MGFLWVGSWEGSSSNIEGRCWWVAGDSGMFNKHSLWISLNNFGRKLSATETETLKNRMKIFLVMMTLVSKRLPLQMWSGWSRWATSRTWSCCPDAKGWCLRCLRCLPLAGRKKHASKGGWDIFGWMRGRWWEMMWLYAAYDMEPEHDFFQRLRNHRNLEKKAPLTSNPS